MPTYTGQKAGALALQRGDTRPDVDANDYTLLYPKVDGSGNTAWYGLTPEGVESAIAGITTLTSTDGSIKLTNGGATWDLSVRMTFGSSTVGASKTFTRADFGHFHYMSNGGAAMAAAFPLFLAADDGDAMEVYNKNADGTGAITWTCDASQTFAATGTNTYTQRANTRQVFRLISGTNSIELTAGNTNLPKAPTTNPANVGDWAQFATTDGLRLRSRTNAQAISDLGLAAIYQPLNTSLSDIAGLSPLASDYLRYTGGHWSRATPAQVTADLSPVTTTAQGVMTAAVYNSILHNSLSSVNILDYGGDNTATTDNATAIASAQSALPAVGGVIYFPSGSYLKGGAVTNLSKTVVLLGDVNAASIIVLTDTANDGFTFSNWNSGIDTIQIAGLATTTSGSRAGGETTIPVNELSNFPTSGSISFGGTAGWVTVTYTGKSASTGAGNLTGCTGVTAAAAGANVMIRTGGYAITQPAVTSSGGNYNFSNNAKIYNVYNGAFFASALGYIDVLEVRNVRNNAVVVDGNNDKFISRLTTASAPVMATSVLVNLTSSLLMHDCQILQGAIGFDLNAANGITIPSVECVNVFFDNNTIGMRVNATGTGSIYRSKFSNCWFSSSTTAGVQFNTANFDGISFSHCEFFGNGTAVDASIVGGGIWSATDCKFAQNTNVFKLAASNGHYPRIMGCHIAPYAAFGANTTVWTVGAGAYKGLQIRNNTHQGNTGLGTFGAVTMVGGTADASHYAVVDNPGLNPLNGPAVATPAFPASATTVTNSTGRRVQAFVKNGTTAPTVATVNGVTVTANVNLAASAFNTYILEPGATIAYTWATTTPTWTWVAM